jgi:hypothetical protein
MPAVNLRPRTSRDIRPKSVAAALIAASLVIIGVAERDLHSRPGQEIRGSKGVWRLVSLNAIGALAYLTIGRSRQTAPSR